ncbi:MULTISPECIES: NfeD family protein [Saccharibacillus]|uniref:Protease n=1 Tax=Saccharibacillus brassicae TaxID=2583377 RepID=A0A4Y6UQV1_SACBS|nr:MULTISPECIES: protease [Saccharibacillus]MWJ33671.1 protease [Saccharibacillus sp. WB 17]QDH20013.1 protease [Saccharibacillus brassicae]
MEALYFGCLAGGVMFALISVVFGDWIGDALGGIFDAVSFEFLQPIVLAGMVTVFGGAGILIERYAGLTPVLSVSAAVLCALASGLLLYLGYVKPMRGSENSVGYSMKDLTGRIGEVTVPVPEKGYGEVLVGMGGSGNTLHTAFSFDGAWIPAGVRVVVIDIEDGTLGVCELEKTEKGLE